MSYVIGDFRVNISINEGTLYLRVIDEINLQIYEGQFKGHEFNFPIETIFEIICQGLKGKENIKIIFKKSSQKLLIDFNYKVELVNINFNVQLKEIPKSDSFDKLDLNRKILMLERSFNEKLKQLEQDIFIKMSEMGSTIQLGPPLNCPLDCVNLYLGYCYLQYSNDEHTLNDKNFIFGKKNGKTTSLVNNFGMSYPNCLLTFQRNINFEYFYLSQQIISRNYKQHSNYNYFLPSTLFKGLFTICGNRYLQRSSWTLDRLKYLQNLTTLGIDCLFVEEFDFDDIPSTVENLYLLDYHNETLEGIEKLENLKYLCMEFTTELTDKKLFIKGSDQLKQVKAKSSNLLVHIIGHNGLKTTDGYLSNLATFYDS